MGAGFIPEGQLTPKMQLRQANNNLRQQVASGAINRNQRLAEMQRLRGLPPDQVAAGNMAARPQPPVLPQPIDPGIVGNSGAKPMPVPPGGPSIQPYPGPGMPYGNDMVQPSYLHRLYAALSPQFAQNMQMPQLGQGSQIQPGVGIGLQPQTQLNQQPKPFGM